MKKKEQILNKAVEETRKLAMEIERGKSDAGFFKSEAVSGKYSHHMVALKELGLIKMIARGQYHLPKPLKTSELTAVAELVLEKRKKWQEDRRQRQQYMQEVTIQKINFSEANRNHVTPQGWVPLLDIGQVKLGQQLFNQEKGAFYQAIARGEGKITAVSQMATVISDPQGWMIQEQVGTTVSRKEYPHE